MIVIVPSATPSPVKKYSKFKKKKKKKKKKHMKEEKCFHVTLPVDIVFVSAIAGCRA
jgi:hypothetical protein